MAQDQSRAASRHTRSEVPSISGEIASVAAMVALLLVPLSAWSQAASGDAAPVAAPAATPTADNESSAPSGTGATLQEVVVTGSIIPTSNGYKAPTPVTVAPAALLQEAAPANLSQGLKDLPQFVGSTGPSTTFLSLGDQGTVLDLRGLGANRTLVLLDGVRVPATSYLNTVNVSVLPQLLVQRVDIVTGGASATYGSDAVAGVVNYVLDTNFTGIKGEAMGGISTYGDDQNERYGLAGGTAIGDHAHLIASLEYYKSAGFKYYERPKLVYGGAAVGSVPGSRYTAGTPQNPLVNISNAGTSYATYGGIVQSGPFAGTNFTSSGLYGPVHAGTPTGTSTLFQGPTDYYQYPLTDNAQAAERDVNAFVRLSYDFGPDTTGYFQFLGGQSQESANVQDNLLALPGFTIFSGNAFLPAPLQAAMTATGTPSFGMSEQFNNLGPIAEVQNVNNYEEQIGIKGSAGRFPWTLDDAFGSVIDTVKAFNEVNFQNFYGAVDSVVNPNTGAIVCRPELSSNPAVVAQYAGCQPFNPFGVGAASPAADAYVTGTSRYDVVTYDNNLQGNIGGNLITLPAGWLTGALGFDYRSQNLRINSNASPSTPYSTAGLRGTNVATQYYYIDQSDAAGSESVKEGYGEVGVPVVSDLPLVKLLALNAALRYTSYSISGSSTEWKYGATWQVYDDLTLRATQSRDIRAPTLYDLFAGEQITTTVVSDTHTGINSGAPQITSGNPSLKPEIGKTFTTGLVFQPHFWPGLGLSLDYYRIGISDAIATLNASAEDQACEASGGTSPACAGIIRPHPFSDHSADNYPTQFIVQGVNIASVYSDGVDLDASYNRHVWGGNLSTRAYATYVNEFSTQLTSNQPLTNYAGWNAAGSGGVAGAIPRFRGFVSLGYTKNGVAAFLQENAVGSLRLGPVLQYVDDYVPAYYTTDLTVSYSGLPQVWGENLQVFLTVTNLFNPTPPRVENNFVAGGVSTIVTLYNTAGRMFEAGVRFNLQ